jgi:hypothetical protein
MDENCGGSSLDSGLDQSLTRTAAAALRSQGRSRRDVVSV